MNARKITITALQLHAHDREEFESVWPGVCAQIEQAAADGSQLIVLPEGTVPAYVIGNAAVDSSVTERALADVRAIARRTRSVIVYGGVRHADGLQFNSAFVVDSDGEVAGFADKCFLWHFDRQWFAKGELRVPVRTSLGTLGVMICADGRIPTIARSLVDAGADILVMPTAWVTSGRDAAQFENIQADLLGAVRARENGVPFVAANKCGVERGCVAYCGKSQIADAAGNIVALGSQHEAQAVSAEIEIAASRATRAATLPSVSEPARPAAMRVAITFEDHVDPQTLALLEAGAAITGSPATDGELGASAAVTVVSDDQIADPGGLVEARLTGAALAVWRTHGSDEAWQRRLVRARAVELRMFVACVVPGKHAFVADPDGAIVCGTFGDFRTALFAFSPERTQQTLVAPGTDVVEGLEHARRPYVRV